MSTPRKVASRREKVIQVESRRREFESRLGRALDMTDEIGSALDVSMRAVRVADAESHTEVLLADSSRSHLTRVAHTVGHVPEATCDVATPGGCPAVKSGSVLRFADSTEFDACPYLRDRGSFADVPVDEIQKAFREAYPRFFRGGTIKEEFAPGT